MEKSELLPAYKMKKKTKEILPELPKCDMETQANREGGAMKLAQHSFAPRLQVVKQHNKVKLYKMRYAFKCW